MRGSQRFTGFSRKRPSESSKDVYMRKLSRNILIDARSAFLMNYRLLSLLSEECFPDAAPEGLLLKASPDSHSVPF